MQCNKCVNLKMYHTLLLCTLLVLFFTALTSAREEHERRVPPRFDVARSQPDDKSTDAGSRAVYWIPMMCDSMAERGYTCYSCEQPMHCMLGNVGLLAVCYGRRPYCNNGVCSDLPSQKCRQQYEQQQLNATHAAHQAMEHVEYEEPHVGVTEENKT